MGCPTTRICGLRISREHVAELGAFWGKQRVANDCCGNYGRGSDEKGENY